MPRRFALDRLLKTLAQTLLLTTLLIGCGDDATTAPADAGHGDTGPDADDDDASTASSLAFTRQQLSDRFLAEGAAFADFDRDGDADIVSGPFVYLGPDFTVTRRFKAGGSFDVRGYSDNFFAFVHDFNDDTWPDVLIVAFPGDHATWYENPEGRDELWPAHRVFEEVDNESPAFEDLDGDGKPELICNHLGGLGFAEPNWDDPTQPWTFRIIANGSWGKFTHGLGVGDVNGDGRKDLILANGVWEQPAQANDAWVAHPAQLADSNTGGAQMFATDVDGDGDRDIVTTLAAHGFGVAWFEQTAPFVFARHLISGTPNMPGSTNVTLFEPHALTLADMDGDGDQDIVTGERHWAHIPQDDRPFASPALLVWFERAGDATHPTFLAHVIDNDSGVGTQVMIGDINNDTHLDVVLANKKGLFAFTQDARGTKERDL